MKSLKIYGDGGLRAAFLLGWPAWLPDAIRDAGTAGFLGQGAAFPGGSLPGSRGRLVVNYPILLTVLLILVLAAVLAVGIFLYYWFSRREGSLESRMRALEHSVKALYQKQQADLDGLLKFLQSASGEKSREEPAEKPDLEKDTRVGRKQDPG